MKPTEPSNVVNTKAAMQADIVLWKRQGAEWEYGNSTENSTVQDIVWRGC